METYDLAIIGTGSGNSILDDRYRRQAGRDLRAGHLRRHLPERRVHPDEDVRLRRRGRPRRFAVRRVTASTRTSTGCAGTTSSRASSGGSIRSRSAARTIGAPRPISTCTRQHTRFGPVQPDGRYLLRTDAGDEFTADQVVIAAGSRPVIPPAILASGVDYHTSDTVMRIAELPEHLVIVGSGFVATEFAHVFSALGVRVTMVIRGSTLLRHYDDTICERFTRIASSKWELRTQRNVVGAANRGSGVTLQLDDGCTINADLLLVATGRVSNADLLDAEQAGVDVERGRVVVDEYQRTSAREVFALGDVSSPYQLKHVANHEARVVQHNLLCDWDDTESMAVTDHRYVPSAVFTDPQLATVGLTENQAIAKGLDISVNDPGLRRRRVRLGDGGHHRNRQAHRRARQRAPTGRAHHGLPGIVDHPAVDSGDELRTDRRRDGPRPVLDSSGAARGGRKRATRFAMTSASTLRGDRRSGTAGIGRAASGPPAPTARRSCPPSRARAPSSAAGRALR